jgi:hypothetical protein
MKCVRARAFYHWLVTRLPLPTPHAAITIGVQPLPMQTGNDRATATVGVAVKSSLATCTSGPV